MHSKDEKCLEVSYNDVDSLSSDDQDSDNQLKPENHCVFSLKDESASANCSLDEKEASNSPETCHAITKEDLELLEYNLLEL